VVARGGRRALVGACGASQYLESALFVCMESIVEVILIIVLCRVRRGVLNDVYRKKGTVTGDGEESWVEFGTANPGRTGNRTLVASWKHYSPQSPEAQSSRTPKPQVTAIFPQRLPFPSETRIRGLSDSRRSFSSLGS
jgi:hypothetical protein